MSAPHSFHTQAYRDGYIHTHVNADGQDVISAQLGNQVRQCNTFAGAQRWITKTMTTTTKS